MFVVVPSVTLVSAVDSHSFHFDAEVSGIPESEPLTNIFGCWVPSAQASRAAKAWETTYVHRVGRAKSRGNGPIASMEMPEDMRAEMLAYSAEKMGNVRRAFA